MGFEANPPPFRFSNTPAPAPRKSSPRPCKSTKNKSRNSSLISTCMNATTSEKGTQAGQADFLNGALKCQKKRKGGGEKKFPHMKKVGYFQNKLLSLFLGPILLSF